MRPKQVRKKRKIPGRETELTRRLQACVEDGNMTVRQLAWFFDRPYQTVYTWVFRNREPFSFYKDEVFTRLDLLERLVGKCKRARRPFVPTAITVAEREAYVRQCYADARLPARSAAE